MTYPATPCFWLEFANEAEWGLRRWTSMDEADVPDCPRDGGKFKKSHGAVLILGRHPAVAADDTTGHVVFAIDSRQAAIDWPSDDDQRWPTYCECGFAFRPDDTHQRWTDMLYRRVDTGELMTIRASPPGAMYDAVWWPKEWWHGPDGRHIVVKCPNGRPWHIDDRASNCGLPDDDVHRCWVRHGDPPNLTVDKNGVTCAAGAGSILADDYHGFLQNGTLTEG